MMQRLSYEQLKARMLSGNEYALLDVRETGAFSKSHLFFACNLPLSRLETLIESRLPRKTVPVTLLTAGADDEELATRAARLLAEAGYENLSLLDGGSAAWASAGGELFSGVNVPSKAFGEFVEHWHDTPRLPAAELAARQEAGQKIAILDSRPFDEFKTMSIPGGIDCPGAELVYRVRDAVPDPATTIVVNCAGRTRSIIGAQSLINAGTPNPVYALKDGTMGWKLAGFTLAHGVQEVAGLPSDGSLDWAGAQTATLASRIALSTIDPQELRDWQADSGRTTYLLDVRTEAEYRAGHWPGAIHAPGGQLVQATDEFVMVRESQLVICDSPDGVRGTMTAHWLWQLGWPSLRLLTAPPPTPETGMPETVYFAPPGVVEVDAAKLRALGQGAGFTADGSVLDFRSSRAYRRGHLPGAAWAIRSRLPACLAVMRQRGQPLLEVLVMADSPALAALASADLQQLLPDASISVISDALATWEAAGGIVETESQDWLVEPDDVWPKPYEGKTDPKVAMQQYLDWEVGLVGQVEREGLARFRRLP